MSKRRRTVKSTAVAVGFAWFDREQWVLLHKVAADRAKLDDTFEEWETNARRALADLKFQGFAAERFEVRVADLVRWCADRNLPIDGAARAEYVSFMLRRKHEGPNLESIGPSSEWAALIGEYAGALQLGIHLCSPYPYQSYEWEYVE